MTPEADAAARRLADWLLTTAAPLWLGAGLDRARGCFAERLDGAGRPTQEATRTLVQCRQTYAAAAIGAAGWDGPWREAVEIGLARITGPCRRADGAFVFSTTPDGAVADGRIDLYTQAFALFALASGYGALGRPARLKGAAGALLDWLDGRLAHEGGGYDETRPRSLPLRSNPHMHLFEAALAWAEADDDPRWEALAARLARLARTRFIDAASGLLREYFAADWTPMADETGRIVEPGHQFEWAWLLARWQALSGQDHGGLIEGLYAFATRPGLCPVRGAAFHEMYPDGAVREGFARLWPQTERIKAATVLGRWDDAAAAAGVLERYLDRPAPGLWRDKWFADGTWDDQPSPASSFYHIVCAIVELGRAAGAVPRA